ncbi:hypothetical protein [Rufibacter sp. XAAS-G3-1]|uniref:hypothetical protein n=1 Tax=Rufibacter sp. XAAS-G3-1 TaxID=2729134 RepID=UPI0015E68F3B|nr:hypothetical protein [Rufibacter sp. XAAS-G3-1]
MEDIILSTIYASVPLMERPTSFPIDTEILSESLKMSVGELWLHLRALLESEFIKVSVLHGRPILFLTKAGLSRVERLCKQPLDQSRVPLF